MPQAAAYRVATCLIVSLIEEIILIVRSCKVIFSPGFASEWLAVTDFLQIVQTAGDALIAVAVESVEIDAGSVIYAGVHFRALQDRLSVRIYDAGSCGAVGVDEVAVLICLIIGTLQIAVAQRRLDGGKSRHGFAVALQLALTLIIGSLDGGLDLVLWTLVC